MFSFMMKPSFIKHIKNAALAVFTTGFLFSSAPAKTETGNITVLELFTSQGCSSCPPADALLGALDKRPNILALTFPVDYWDYIGWKDTFASPQFTKRQHAYAAAQGKFQVYTPQMMINGTDDAVGSSRRQVESKIKRYQSDLNKHVNISSKDLGDKFHLTLSPKGAATAPATLWVVGYQKKATVDIGRGENRGRTVIYTNVVRVFKPLGKWSGSTKSIELPKSALKGKDIDGAAAFLQEGEGGRIIAAQKLAL